MKYFINSPYTAESLKAEFRALCLTMHPDKGGNADEFKAMSAEYNDILASLTNGNGTTADKARTAATAKAYEQTQHAAHVREARKHQSEGNKAPKAGAFVFGVSSGMKCDGGHGIFEEFLVFAWRPDYITVHEDDERRNLCKVCEVYEVSAEDFARPELADELVKKAHDEGRKFAGGNATDDPEPADDPRDPYAKYKYYYTKVAAVVCRESGRWFLIDSEGYEYARYCYMPKNFRTMYAQEIREAQDRHAAQVEAERQEEERKAAERLAEYRAKCAKYEAAGLEDLTEYREAVKTANREESEAGRAHGWRSAERKAAGKRTQAAAAALMAAEKRNIKRMAETAYPGIKCKVTKADSWRSAGYKLTYEDGPTLEDFQNNTDFDLFAAYWEEYRMDDCTELHRHDLTEFADKYGDGRGVEIAREMSKAERERMTAAILEAVPAAAGICWENRHAWTQEEVTAAAAAVGVDGWDLWRIYDHKHSYFNYVTAEELAEWAHELTAYDIKGKKTRTTSAQSESRPQEAATAADADNTPQETREAVTASTTDTATNGEGLRIEKYSEKATVIRGYNAEQAAELEAMGGKEWRNLRGGKGYIFSTRRHGDELREWMKQQQTATASAPADDQQTATASETADLSPVLQAFADVLRIFADIMQQAKQWEGVTIPAATLARWKQEAEDGTKTAAARLCEVCACLASLTPDSRRDFDALGAIFWSLSEQIRNGCDPDTLQAATDYARAQLFDLIDRTQNENQARAVREATDDEQRRAA